MKHLNVVKYLRFIGCPAFEDNESIMQEDRLNYLCVILQLPQTCKNVLLVFPATVGVDIAAMDSG